jgi:SAM-dependent methyltransferase
MGRVVVKKPRSRFRDSVPLAAREAVAGVLRRLAWAWAGAPSGPLGWISAHWVMPRLHAGIYPAMAAVVQPQQDDDLLEVACGSGVFLAEHAEHVGFVAGLDLSDIQVGLARQRLADRIGDGTAEIVQGDVGAMPWPAERFTLVTCMGSFEAFPDPGRALGEVHRVLRPGGRAVLNIGERVPAGTSTHQFLDALWVWSEDDVRSLVEQAGLVDVRIRYVDYSGESQLSKLLSGPELRVVEAVRSPEAHGPGILRSSTDKENHGHVDRDQKHRH